MKPGELDGFLAAQFAAADADRDGAVGPADFAAYYGSLGVCRARQQLRATMGVEAESAILTAREWCRTRVSCLLSRYVREKLAWGVLGDGNARAGSHPVIAGDHVLLPTAVHLRPSHETGSCDGVLAVCLDWLACARSWQSSRFVMQPGNEVRFRRLR